MNREIAVSLVVLALLLMILTFGVGSYFIIETYGPCPILDIDPWDPSLKGIVTVKATPVVCSTRPPLTFTEESEGRQHLRVAESAVSYYAPRAEDIECQFFVIVRDTDSTNQKSPWLDLDQDAILDRDVENVFVRCSRRGTKTELYVNVHAVVQVPADRAEHSERFNVFMLGIDSMSRQNFQRTLPKLAALLKTFGWVEMQGYNKMAEQTVPNLGTLLTGNDVAQNIAINCMCPNPANRFDHCPFMWKEFKRSGYTTAYAEDGSRTSTFNYCSKGFEKKPTDLYMHPLMVEAHKGIVTRRIGAWALCLGETSTTDVLLNWTIDLMTTFKNNLFALIWLNNFSHDSHLLPATMDGRLVDFFETMVEQESFNNTVFVFLSDHGYRRGLLSKTYVGWLESRLPFLYLWLPPRFRARYPEAAAHLDRNQKKLASPFDLYLTLKDLVEERVGQPRHGSAGCATCQSLFQPVKERRSCSEAGISRDFCACSANFRWIYYMSLLVSVLLLQGLMAGIRLSKL